MKVRLEKRPLANGRVSIYLNINNGNFRQRKSLGIILDKPTSADIRQANLEKMLQAEVIKARYEIDSISKAYRIRFARQQRVILADAFAEFQDSYSGKDIQVVKALGKHLAAFTGTRHIYLDEIDAKFAKDFSNFLYSHLNGSSPANYFKKFKAFMARMSERELIASDPTKGIRLTFDESLKKATLSFAELAMLSRTECPLPEVKRAFLFACNTGLRWCDLSRLTARDISLQQRTLTIVQQKVACHSSRSRLIVGLNDNAYKLALAAMHHSSAGSPIFKLPSYNKSLRALAVWAKSSGIGKHITFHCARHTFITNLIAEGTNLPVVARLAGHSSTKHTERYVHIAEALKAEAVNKLPHLPGI